MVKTKRKEKTMLGNWLDNFYCITIHKLHNNQFSIRDDIIDKVKSKRGQLRVRLEQTGENIVIPYDKIDERRAWVSLPQPSKFGKPYRLVYFQVTKKEDERQMSLLQ